MPLSPVPHPCPPRSHLAQEYGATARLSRGASALAGAPKSAESGLPGHASQVAALRSQISETLNDFEVFFF